MISHLLICKPEDPVGKYLKTKHRRKTGIKSILFTIVMLVVIIFLSAPAPARNVRYNNPKVRGYALDRCQKWGRNCGKPAADAFCRSRGFGQALDYRVLQNRPPTRIIGTGQVCRAPACDRIVKVTCESRAVVRDHRNGGRPQNGGGDENCDKCDETGSTMPISDDDDKY